MSAMHAVILAGGRGERFWPMSTVARPKQVIPLLGGKTFLQKAVERLEGLIPSDHVWVVTSRDLVAVCAGAAPSVPRGQILGEPVGRDTGAAIALGAAAIARQDPGAVFCVLTADHEIPDAAAFRLTLGAALRLAEAEEVLVTLGIEPTGPSTAYGYIEAGALRPGRDGVRFHDVVRFVEKPPAEVAERYLRTGGFYWNSGMFAWSVPSLLAGFRAQAPHLADLAERLRTAGPGPAFEAALDTLYPALPRISIDYALMEKACNLVMARGAFEWDDLGSWSALERHVSRTAAGNAVIGDCEAMDATDNLVVSGDRMTALIGVSGLVVVQAQGVTLICPKDRAQDVKRMVARLAETERGRKLL
jgi:mannose-1-phosphate guanylyltransferase